MWSSFVSFTTVSVSVTSHWSKKIDSRNGSHHDFAAAPARQSSKLLRRANCALRYASPIIMTVSMSRANSVIICAGDRRTGDKRKAQGFRRHLHRNHVKARGSPLRLPDLWIVRVLAHMANNECTAGFFASGLVESPTTSHAADPRPSTTFPAVQLREISTDVAGAFHTSCRGREV